MSNNPKNKQKSFEIAPPSLSSAEDEAFAKVLDSMLGRLGTQIPSPPQTRITGYPDTHIPDEPVTQIPARPDTQTPTYPDPHVPEYPDTQSIRVPNLDTQISVTGTQIPSRPIISQDKLFRSRIERRQTSIRLPVQKLERYRTWCFINKIDFQDAVEQALDAWIAGYPDSHMMINDYDESDDEISSIIRSYEQWTGNKASAKDREAIREVRDQSLTVIQCGILLSILRAPAKINSFRYCIGAIREAASSGVGASDDYLNYLKKVAARRNQAS